MKLTIKNFKGNLAVFMRSRGYAFDKKTGNEFSFVRRITGQDFPRFHAYVRTSDVPRTSDVQNSGTDLVINLHLDQKRPSYETGPAHGGEYGGELINEELERIKDL